LISVFIFLYPKQQSIFNLIVDRYRMYEWVYTTMWLLDLFWTYDTKIFIFQIALNRNNFALFQSLRCTVRRASKLYFFLGRGRKSRFSFFPEKKREFRDLINSVRVRTARWFSLFFRVITLSIELSGIPTYTRTIEGNVLLLRLVASFFRMKLFRRCVKWILNSGP
jgi:hypothetical protein